MDEIITRVADSKHDVDHKVALLNCLYSQVDFLRNDIIEKNKIIGALVSKINNSTCACITSKSCLPNCTLNLSDVSSEIDCFSTTSEVSEREKLEEENKNNINVNFAAWEKYTSGFGRKMLFKMGYDDGCLGKASDGIKSPIVITPKHDSSALCGEYNNYKKHRVSNNVHAWPTGTTLDNR